ncbi:MAG: hypothetical protein IKO10_15945 [Lachnospiraceae bacterium]|nr:hypothetical protein [Lachnospiraceae bacterium]
MAIFRSGMAGAPLIEIIRRLGNKTYPHIDIGRIRFENNQVVKQAAFESCSYDSSTGVLTPGSGDGHSLNDLYVAWEEGTENNLKVWKC